MTLANWQVWTAAGTVVLGLAIVGSVVGGDSDASALIEDDTYHRIVEDNAGEYLTVGPRGDEPCLWNRASKSSRKVEDMIDVGEAKRGRNTTVELHAGDYFISWGCYPWRRQ